MSHVLTPGCVVVVVEVEVEVVVELVDVEVDVDSVVDVVRDVDVVELVVELVEVEVVVVVPSTQAPSTHFVSVGHITREYVQYDGAQWLKQPLQ